MPRRTTILDQLPTSSTTVRPPVRPPVVGPDKDGSLGAIRMTGRGSPTGQACTQDITRYSTYVWRACGACSIGARPARSPHNQRW